MKVRNLLWLIIYLCLIALVLPACSRAAPKGNLPDIGKLQVGYIPIIGYAPVFVAVEKGYFAEQGLEVELQSFNSGSLMIAPLSTGQLDVGAGETGTSLFNAIAQDLDIRVVAGLASQPPGYGATPILIRKDLVGVIDGPEDFKGRKVAINIEHGVAEYLLAMYLAKAGLNVDDVEIVTLPIPEMGNAFANGAIDAALQAQPASAKSVSDGVAEILVDGDMIVDTPQNGVIYFGKRLLDPANREIGVRYLMAYLKAARDLYGDGWRSDENAAIINKYTQVPIPAIQKGVAYYFDPNGGINTASTESIQQYLFERGYTELEKPLPVEEIIDDTFIEETLQRIGEFSP